MTGFKMYLLSSMDIFSIYVKFQGGYLVLYPKPFYLSLLFWGLGKIASSFDSICSTTSMQTWTVFILQLWQTPMSLLMAVLSEQFRVCWKGFFSQLILAKTEHTAWISSSYTPSFCWQPVPEIRCHSHFEADSLFEDQLNNLWVSGSVVGTNPWICD